MSLEQAIEETARNLSRLLQHAGQLPTSSGYNTMKEDLAFKEGEMEKSKSTLDGINREHGQLQQNLEKVSKMKKRDDM